MDDAPQVYERPLTAVEPVGWIYERPIQLLKNIKATSRITRRGKPRRKDYGHDRNSPHTFTAGWD